LLRKSEVVEALERIPESIDTDSLEQWTRAPGGWSRAAPHLLYECGVLD
jgi:hypothetical protein